MLDKSAVGPVLLVAGMFACLVGGAQLLSFYTTGADLAAFPYGTDSPIPRKTPPGLLLTAVGVFLVIYAASRMRAAVLPDDLNEAPEWLRTNLERIASIRHLRIKSLGPAAEQQISEVASDLGHAIPSEYREILNWSNGVGLGRDLMILPAEGTYVLDYRFIGPGPLLIFASTESGPMYGLSLQPTDSSGITPVVRINKDMDDSFVVAQSIEEWLVWVSR